MKTVKVKTGFGELIAPRGFGATYRRIAAEHARDLANGEPGKVTGPIRSLLGLIGYDVPIKVIAEWDAQKRIEAEAYAANVHLRASDNPIQRHPKPDWLPEPWKGPEQIGPLSIESPGGTPLLE